MRSTSGPTALVPPRDDAQTRGVIVDSGLELLTEDEARQLLAGGEVGRIGITMGALPAIFPVNYRVLDGAIVFRTAPGSKLSAAAAGAVVAFEVDDYGVFDRSGWSVLAVGQAQVVDDDALRARVAAAGLEPFVDGERSAIVRIEPTFLSGRKLVHGR
jgi:nitroimidazol reductase NimA-like FMN-containing flavoprotein (pyridoxamine 5'-phosphate oxidase superfamily)